MKYPLDFIDDVLAQFPEYSYLQKMFKRGDPNIGKFLEDIITYLTNIDFDDVVRTHHIKKWQVDRDLKVTRKLHEQYLEIEARQQEYSNPNPYRSLLP